jgi:hypothetical protein
MKQQQQEWRLGILLLLLLSCAIVQVSADPSGATITSASSVTSANASPSFRSDARSTITTMLLNSVQQSSRWKAYVGNVTGSLTLDNPLNYTIYSWDLTSLTGQVYASRFGNLTWSSVSCAPAGLITNESTFFSMTNSHPDKINSTFNWSIHKTFSVGTNTITTNTCNSTVTYMNDTRQVPTTASPFQEVLTQDANGYLVYMTDISDNTQGYDNTTYDFQMIVPEAVSGGATSYYFYAELR